MKIYPCLFQIVTRSVVTNGQEKHYVNATELFPDAGTELGLEGFDGADGVYQIEGQVQKREYPNSKGGGVTKRMVLKVARAVPVNFNAVAEQLVKSPQKAA